MAVSKSKEVKPVEVEPEPEPTPPVNILYMSEGGVFDTVADLQQQRGGAPGPN